MRGQPCVYETLDALKIKYQLLEHDPVFTVEDTRQKIAMPPGGGIAKNLFLRDARGKRHFLVMVPPDEPANLADLGQRLGAGKVSFGSEKRLMQFLGLTKGSVSLFGLLNDPTHAVEAVVDARLSAFPLIGFHPNDNSATLFITYNDLLTILEHTGASTTFL